MTDESANKEQTFTVLAQYIKDLSFENLHPLSKLASEDAKSPQIDVQMHINVEDDARPDVYTVSMKIEIKAEMKALLFAQLAADGDEILCAGSPYADPDTEHAIAMWHRTPDGRFVLQPRR